MFFDVFVRFSSEDVKLGCRWRVIRAYREGYYVGDYTTTDGHYDKEEVGAVLTFIFQKMFNIGQVEVRAAFSEDEQESIPYGGARSECPGDVRARDSF